MNSTIEAISAMPSQEKASHLLVMLHGWGANYQDFVPLAKMLNFSGCGYLFPNAPFEHFQVSGGKAWYALESNELTGLAESRKLLLDWLTSLEASTGVPLNRTILAGFSQGGAMALDVGLTLPLAAIGSFSGYLHYQPQSHKEQVFPPIMIIHGQQDTVIPIQAARKAQQELTDIGVVVQYQELAMAHEIQEQAIALFKQFILDNVNFS